MRHDDKFRARRLKEKRGCVNQGKSSGTVAFRANTNFMEVKNLKNMYTLLPATVKDTQRFCCWKYEQRHGRKTKVPYDPVTGRRAETNRPDTFRNFTTAVAAAEKYDGIGFLVGDNICAIDLDDCFEENGNLKPVAQDIVDIFSSCYMERSPSGKGIHIIFMASNYTYDKAKYYINNGRIGLEVYVGGATNRFVTLTGNVYRKGDVPDKAEALQSMLDKYMQRPMPTSWEKYLRNASTKCLRITKPSRKAL